MKSFESDGCEPRRYAGQLPVSLHNSITPKSAISGTVGAILGANAQNAATSSARKSQKQTNAQNLQMFNESRGSTGSAVLPLYLKNPDGSLFESSLGKDLISGYNDTSVPLSTFSGATARLAGAEKGA